MQSSPTFEQMETDLRSDQAEVRGRAIHHLYFKAKKDRRLQSRALPLFQSALASAADSWTVNLAAQGVELILGAAEGRKVWLALLNDPRDEIASGAALMVNSVDYIPELVRLLATRPTPQIQFGVMRALGRTKKPEFLSTILPFLENPEMRVQAIIALQELEDPRAIEKLEPLIKDDTDSGMTDDRGCILRVGYLAGSAVRRLQYVSGQEPPTPVSTPPAKPAPSASRATPRVGSAAQSNSTWAWLPLLPFIPLLLFVIEIPWVIILIMLKLSSGKGRGATELSTHSFDQLALILPLLGLAVAFYVVIAKSARRRAETICLWLGAVACVLIALPFFLELGH